MKSVNLIPTARRDAKRRRRHRNTCAAACGAYGALLAAAVGVAHLALGSNGVSLDQRLASTESEIQRAQQEADKARRELTSARATIEANRTVSEQPDWSVLLAMLAKTTSDDVVLRGVTIGPPSGPQTDLAKNAKASTEPVLEVMGFGQTQLAVSRHVLRMEQTGMFSKVMLMDTGRETYMGGPAIAFRLQCTFGEPRRPAAVAKPEVTSVDAGGITR